MLLFVFIALPFAPGLPAWLRQTVVLASLAFFGALEPGEPRDARLLDLWRSGEIEASPEALEAAQFLVALLAERGA